MIADERNAARAAHAEAIRLAGEARTALATATSTRDFAIQKRNEVVEQAASGSKISAAHLVEAGRAVAKAEAGIELARSIAAAAARREDEAAELAREAENLDRHRRLTAATQRRFDAAEKVDAAIATVIEAMAELDAAGAEMVRNGSENPNMYHLQMNGKALTSIADLERRIHLPRRPLTPAEEMWRARLMPH